MHGPLGPPWRAERSVQNDISDGGNRILRPTQQAVNARDALATGRRLL
ncbi:hypothetical protein [Streptomyces sp. NPDC059262]